MQTKADCRQSSLDQRMHILLAEDNDANRMIARAILEREGHRVTTTVNGIEAVKLCKRQVFDALLLDIMMPDMDGLKTLRRIKNLKNANSNSPVLALTAFSSPADRNSYRFAGFAGVLPKPLRSGQFSKFILQLKAGGTPRVPSKANTFSSKSPILEEDIIKQLRDVADPVAISLAQDEFWESLDKCISQLEIDKPLVVRGDMAAMARFRGAVHLIKGASATIGLTRASHLARQLQNAPPDEIPSLLDALTKCLSDSRTPLQAALS